MKPDFPDEFGNAMVVLIVGAVAAFYLLLI